MAAFPRARHDVAARPEGAVAQLGERLVRNEEVRGSIPLGSTSLRPLRGLRLGKPAFANTSASREKRGEGCRAEARRAKADRAPRGAPARRASLRENPMPQGKKAEAVAP